MDAAHLHLMLNHIPVVGSMIGILLLLYAALKGSSELYRVCFALFSICAVFAAAVYLTGEPAEEIVEKIQGVSEAVIERHEQAALVSLIAMGILGAASLTGLFLFRKSAPPKWFAAGMLLLSLGVGGSMAWTANLGGQIRHTEIRSGIAASSTNDDAAPGRSAEAENDD